MTAEATQERQSTDRSLIVEPGIVVQEHSAGKIPTQKGIKHHRQKKQRIEGSNIESHLQRRTETHPSPHD